MTRRTALNALLSVAGAALLVWQIQQAGGVNTVWNGVTSVGLGAFALVLVLSLARFALRSYAWMVLLNARVPFASAVGATISGDALGNLTLLSLAASEPAKALYLKKYVDTTQALAALMAENFFYTVSIALYIIVGAGAMFWSFEHLPGNVRSGGIAVLGAVAAGLAVAGWIAVKRPTILSGLVARLPSRALASYVDRVRDFEERAYGSAGPGTPRLLRVASAEIGFHALSFAESWLVLFLLTGGQSRPLEALILDSVSRAINVIFKPVPMQLGVSQVSSELVAVAIGLVPGIGLGLALVKTLRQLVWAGVGLVIWTTRRGRT